MTDAIAEISTLSEVEMRVWLESAIRNYVDNAEEPFLKFRPLIIQNSEYLAHAVPHYFFKLAPAAQARFRRALASCAYELSPFDPVFSRMFGACCELAGYIKVPDFLAAIRSHVLIGRLRSPRNDLEFEISAAAIQALDMLLPHEGAKELLQELYNEPTIRLNHSTALLSAMCEIEPDNWPSFVRDFCFSPTFQRLAQRPERLIGAIENVVAAVTPHVIAATLYRLVALLPVETANLLFCSFFRCDDRPLVLFSESDLALHFPNLYEAERNYELRAYRWYLTTSENFDAGSGLPKNPAALLRVDLGEIAPNQNQTDGDFIELLNRYAVKENLVSLLMSDAA